MPLKVGAEDTPSGRRVRLRSALQIAVLFGGIALGSHEAVFSQDPPWDQQRQRMVDEQLKKRGIRDPRVLEALNKVPRHLFVEPESKSLAYADHPLPIGYGQTISQPYIVDTIDLKPTVLTSKRLKEPLDITVRTPSNEMRNEDHQTHLPAVLRTHQKARIEILLPDQAIPMFLNGPGELPINDINFERRIIVFERGEADPTNQEKIREEVRLKFRLV